MKNLTMQITGETENPRHTGVIVTYAATGVVATHNHQSNSGMANLEQAHSDANPRDVFPGVDIFSHIKRIRL